LGVTGPDHRVLWPPPLAGNRTLIRHDGMHRRPRPSLRLVSATGSATWRLFASLRGKKNKKSKRTQFAIAVNQFKMSYLTPILTKAG